MSRKLSEKFVWSVTWFLIITGFVVPVAAQQNCGNGLPCGPVPWTLPNMPNLPSPTRFPTIIVTATPSATPIAVTPGDPTEIPATDIIDLSELEDQIATLNAIIASTPASLDDVETYGEDVTDLAGNAQDAFSYVKGLSGVHFGVLTLPVTFLLFALVFVLGNEMLFFIVPIASAIFGFIRKVITLILDFLPL